MSYMKNLRRRMNPRGTPKYSPLGLAGQLLAALIVPVGEGNGLP